MIADNGKVVVKFGNQVNSPIHLYDNDLENPINIASGFSVTGRSPGISDSGKIVAFAGDRGNGPGIFVSVDTGAGRELINIVGENNNIPLQLGYSSFNSSTGIVTFPLFDSTGFDIDSRVGVSHVESGRPGIVDDTFTISFIGKPDSSSLNNAITGNPLLFSDQKGLWTVKVNVDSKLNGASGFDFNPTSAIPVVQVGDKVNGATINDIAVYDPIANVGITNPAPDSHQVAFWANTTAGEMILRAGHLDTDGDGLLDHWEESGIDIDGDGNIDLDLKAMGANKNKKDLFLEIDWLAPDRNTGRDFAPQAAALDFVVKVFDAQGINVHIDAGAGLDQNMGTGPLEGGDLIREAGTGNHIDLVYFDADFPSSGPIDVNGDGLAISRSFGNIKDNFFGTTTKRARELVFRYVLFADYSDLNGSSGIAELAEIDPRSRTNDNGTPTNTSDDFEEEDLPVSDPRSIPGNDLIVSLQGERNVTNFAGSFPSNVAIPAGFLQGQTLLHELGHALGLRHGGADNDTTDPLPSGGNPIVAARKSSYKSVMNYLYQLYPDTSTTPPTLIRDYSSGSPFDDWSNIQLGFANYFPGLGNSFGLFSLAGSTSNSSHSEELTVDDIRQIFGPNALDSQVPVINSISAPTNVNLGDSIVVNVNAIDNVGIQSVDIFFDINGDGDIDDFGETVTATQISTDQYQATFTNIAGSADLRIITAAVTDLAEFVSSETTDISVINGLPLDIDYSITTNIFSLSEGNSGGQTVIFTISRTGATQEASSVDYSIGGSAINGDDYNNIGGTSVATGLTGTVAFVAGETAKTITLDVLGDTDFEPNEAIDITLSGGTTPNGTATLSTPSATTTIDNDDPAPPTDIDYSITTDNDTLAEGDSGFQTITFTITRSGATQDASSVDYTIGGSATNGDDYNNIGGNSGATGLTGTVAFIAGETTKTITLDILGETDFEPDEAIDITLSNGVAPNGIATISTATATTIINNDDAQIPVTFATLSTPAGDGGLTVTVDAFGAFGSDASNDAFYDPVGDISEAGTTFESAVAIRIGDTGERTFLSAVDIGGSGNLINPDFTNTDTTLAESSFSFAGLSFDLTQTVSDTLMQTGERTGSLLTQTYNITNPGDEAISFELLRYLDGDLLFDGSLTDGGGRLISGSQEILFETDTAGEPDTSTTFVGITGEGGIIDLPGRFEIDEFSGLLSRIIDGVALDDIITNDGADADEFVDAGLGYDITLALRNAFVLNPGEATTYATTTIFGSGAPEDVPINAPPEAINDSAITAFNMPVAINVLGNDIDINDDVLTIEAFDTTSTTGGGISLDDNGTPDNSADDQLVYTPATDFVGTDSFEYIITDGEETAVATVEVIVEPPPVTFATLSTPPGDGGLTVTVDAFGAFGSDASDDAFYDPAGDISEAGTTFESAVAIRIGDTGERTFLSAVDIGGSGNLINPDFTNTDTTLAESSFSFLGLSFDLTQTVSDTLMQTGERTGSLLTQTYNIINPTDQAISFELLRYLDGDLPG